MYDANKIIVSGAITTLEPFKTKKDMFALNLHLKSTAKYEDTIPCVAYGQLAEMIIKKLQIGSHVIILGRMMVLPLKDSTVMTARVVVEKIAEEIYISQEQFDNSKRPIIIKK